MEEFDESPRNSREGSLEDIEVPTVSLETMNAMNYYSVLGLKSDATDKEINKAFKHLVVRYNPDRNPGNAEAAEKHKIVNRAYETLKDPKKRAEYDKPQITEEDPSTVDGEKMKEGEPGSQQPGTLASFTKVFSSFSAPSLPSVSLSFKQAAEGISTKAPLSPEFVEMATAICSGGALSNDSSFVDTRVSDVIWGWPIEGRVDRLGGQFYRLCLNLEEIENGFLITARSPAKDRFKIAIFDKSATMVMLEESMRSRDGKCTEICMHFTEFEVSPAFIFNDFTSIQLNDMMNFGCFT
jgi:curved DNA-binding protein CbpA